MYHFYKKSIHCFIIIIIKRICLEILFLCLVSLKGENFETCMHKAWDLILRTTKGCRTRDC